VIGAHIFDANPPHMTQAVSDVIGHCSNMEGESELEKRMARDNAAADDLQKLLEVYQGNRTPENRAAYLLALRASQGWSRGGMRISPVHRIPANVVRLVR